jgi:hypothetical protein
LELSYQARPWPYLPVSIENRSLPGRALENGWSEFQIRAVDDDFAVTSFSWEVGINKGCPFAWTKDLCFSPRRKKN